VEPDELTALLHDVRDRVRARYPTTAAGPAAVPLADLMPLVHARDAAQAKVASIGTVNPRGSGPLNAVIQWAKRIVARALDWHVREQVEFNRNAMACVEAALESMNEFNRALMAISGHLGAAREEAERLRAEAAELKDMRTHWQEWRVAWEQKLAANEIQFLRSVADLQAAFAHRTSLAEANFRDLIRTQHADFAGALDRSGAELQKRLWSDVDKIRLEFERLIHQELRVLRQRAAALPAAPAPPPPPAAGETTAQYDELRFAERFRGGEEHVRAAQRFYLPYFAGRDAVLDVGCGRGEFLELMREAGVAARGVDLSAESVALCRAKGLEAEQADLFPYLAELADASLDGIFCGQVIEHLPRSRIPEAIRLFAAKLERGGLLAIETPNPASLAIFATHFYLDPSHQHPVPHPLAAFYLEEAGFGGIEVHTLAPTVVSMPSAASLPEDFRETFFGGLDYAIIARKL
jgi:O-antigen chain-terminating methyltransferase